MTTDFIDILEQNRLKYINQIENYFKKYRGHDIFTIIPALDSNDVNAQSYYSVNLISDEKTRVSPVFLLINPEFDTSTFDEMEGILLFDNERPYVYETNIYGTVRKHKSTDFQKIVQYLSEHPVMLIFKGCDDVDIAKRFKTKEEAIEFLSLLDKFEDIFEFDISYLN